MAETRQRIGLQLEKSASAGSIIVTNAQNEQTYVAPGTNGDVLTVVAGVPTYQAPASSSLTISDGTTTDVFNTGETLTFTAGNGITTAVTDNEVTITARLSATAGNDLSINAWGLYLQETETSIAQNTTTGVITFTNEAGAASTANLLSGDANNNLSVGSDGGLFYDAPAVLTWAAWDDATNTLNLTLNTDGATSTVAVPIVDTVAAFIHSYTLAGDTGTDQTITNSDTITLAGWTGLQSVGSATDTITFNITQSEESFDVTSATWSTVTLAATPDGTLPLNVYRNGVKQDVTDDYTIAGTTITFVTAFGSSTWGTDAEKITVVYYT